MNLKWCSFYIAHQVGQLETNHAASPWFSGLCGSEHESAKINGLKPVWYIYIHILYIIYKIDFRRPTKWHQRTFFHYIKPWHEYRWLSHIKPIKDHTSPPAEQWPVADGHAVAAHVHQAFRLTLGLATIRWGLEKVVLQWMEETLQTLQDGAPKIAKLPYKWLYGRYNYS